MNLSPAEKREQELRESKTRITARYAIWVHPCYFSEHAVNRKGGYLAFDSASGGYPYVTPFGSDVRFFATEDAAKACTKVWESFFVAGCDIQTFRVTEFVLGAE